MLNQLRSKKGGTIIFLVILLALLFPVIMSGIMDLTNAFKIEKRLKTTLNASVKSASSRVDWSVVPQGTFRIDENKAKTVFADIFNKNLGVTLNPINSYYTATSSETGNTVTAFVTIYNNRHTGTFVDFPSAGTIPAQVTHYNLSAKVDRPTVVGVATAYMKLSPIFGGGTIKLTQFASSQLNYIPQQRQPSNNLLNNTWSTFQYNGTPTILTSYSTGGYNNGKYLRLTGTGYGDSGAILYVPSLKTNTNYKFSAMIKIPNAGTTFGNGLLFICNNTNGVGIKAVNLSTTNATGWVKAEGTFNTGSNTAVHYRIDRGDFSEILVSDVQLYEK